MTDCDHIEQLTPLDLAMPNTYIRVLLVFPGPEADSTLNTLHTLQTGLAQLSKQIPWLSGRIFPTTDASGRSTLEIRSHTGATPTLEDKGTIAASYATLSAQNMPPEAIPGHVWPLPAMPPGIMEQGIPVFAASVFRFIDRGIGLCICLHHHSVDATGFAAVVRLWAQATTTTTSRTTGRTLSSEHSHLHHLRTLHTLVQKYTHHEPTTNTLATALLWTTITRVRTRRTPNLLTQESNSTLTTAVNGRPRLSPLTPGYIGNLVLYATATYPAPALATADMDPVRALAEICECITQSLSPDKIGERFVAEVYALVQGVEDYRGLYPGWEGFGDRDVTVTSWAGVEVSRVKHTG
ncbi:hypothetical protein BP00DRAFT_333463 [Aspergillus indologenus CBS 114.80]|uniref:Trichothecene 3-O-acetyltransferase-like N-terminal domain-containing protein n=1 Tax=Aspergillus indologenus CBS 114.80 TaxID=1450541 RepID=A0A2V5IND6_9EURO|nr:hypothetical protein BP00DRAFT_333463 [Aspergillus indologenus CBS 114.80]